MKYKVFTTNPFFPGIPKKEDFSDLLDDSCGGEYELWRYMGAAPAHINLNHLSKVAANSGTCEEFVRKMMKRLKPKIWKNACNLEITSLILIPQTEEVFQQSIYSMLAMLDGSHPLNLSNTENLKKIDRINNNRLDPDALDIKTRQTLIRLCKSVSRTTIADFLERTYHIFVALQQEGEPEKIAMLLAPSPRGFATKFHWSDIEKIKNNNSVYLDIPAKYFDDSIEDLVKDEARKFLAVPANASHGKALETSVGSTLVPYSGIGLMETQQERIEKFYENLSKKAPEKLTDPATKFLKRTSIFPSTCFWHITINLKGNLRINDPIKNIISKLKESDPALSIEYFAVKEWAVCAPAHIHIVAVPFKRQGYKKIRLLTEEEAVVEWKKALEQFGSVAFRQDGHPHDVMVKRVMDPVVSVDGSNRNTGISRLMAYVCKPYEHENTNRRKHATLSKNEFSLNNVRVDPESASQILFGRTFNNQTINEKIVQLLNYFSKPDPDKKKINEINSFIEAHKDEFTRDFVEPSETNLVQLFDKLDLLLKTFSLSCISDKSSNDVRLFRKNLMWNHGKEMFGSRFLIPKLTKCIAATYPGLDDEQIAKIMEQYIEYLDHKLKNDGDKIRFARAFKDSLQSNPESHEGFDYNAVLFLSKIHKSFKSLKKKWHICLYAFVHNCQNGKVPLVDHDFSAIENTITDCIREKALFNLRKHIITNINKAIKVFNVDDDPILGKDKDFLQALDKFFDTHVNGNTLEAIIVRDFIHDHCPYRVLEGLLTDDRTIMKDLNSIVFDFIRDRTDLFPGFDRNRKKDWKETVKRFYRRLL